jgi:hypothetical protein
MRISMKKISILFLFLIIALPVSAQQHSNSLQGKVIDGMTMKPVPFSLIIVKEAGLVSTSKPDGSFKIDLPKPGRYTITVQSQGLQTLVTSVTVEGSVTIDFTLNPFISKSDNGVTVRGERDIQSISRQTMTQQEIKEVPASFNDSIGALTSLPGVNRAGGGFFGPLIIRGADSSMNGYFIDDIPMYKLMHFGGLDSVISNDFIGSIDLYSSAFPSQFGNAQAAVININSVDEVKKSGGTADIGLISSNAYFETPITREVITDGKAKDENTGYIMAAGRYGYLSVFIPFFYDNIMHQNLPSLPDYWDYQFKAKYDLNNHNSITLLAFGSKDMWFLNLKDIQKDPGADPLMKGIQFYTNDQTFNQGLYYTYTYSPQFENTVMGYASLTQSTQWADFTNSTQSWGNEQLGVSSDPNIFGVKDKLRLEWWKSHAEFRGAVEATIYDFEVSGNQASTTSDSKDLNKSGLIQVTPVNNTYINKIISGYAENKFTFGGLLVVPGVHIENLSRTNTTTIDPRGMASFTFPTNTTIGVAGGYYSAFFQTNPTYFTTDPTLAGNDALKPQRSIHRSISAEQKIDIYSFKAEGFYNTFTDLVEKDSYMDGTTPVSEYKNEGKLTTYGIELLAKIKDESEQGLFGWISYTYNQSQFITHESANYSQWGSYWLNSQFDMPHVVKAVAGYTFGKQTLSTRIQYNSSTPYTPIVPGAVQDPDYTAGPRFVPVYGKPYSARFDPQYSVDVRYSYKQPYSWGYISWYIEAIGIISSPTYEQKWDYRYPYSPGVNPSIVKQSGLSFIPNFGVEVKF